MENWLTKYKPKKISDVLGNKQLIKKIDTFIKQFAKKPLDINKIDNPNLIIIGPNGIGKTLITDLVIKENNFQKISADLSTISVNRKSKKTKRSDKETTNSNRTIRTYYLSLKNNKQLLPTGEFSRNKVVLVLDNVSNISNPKEKEALKTIVKMNNKFKEFPIIIIANNKHSKTVNELKKMVTYTVKKVLNDGRKKTIKIANEIIMLPPEYHEMESLIIRICKEENLKLIVKKSDEDNLFIEIVKHSQWDVRRLINILEELKLIYGETEISLKKFEQYRETSKTKDIDPGIFKATGMLLNNYTDIQTALLLYGEERATIPLMVHENYPLNIRHQYPKMSVDDQIDMIYHISQSISESDRVDGLMYSNQCWSLQPVHGFYSCILPSYYINRHPGKLCKYESYKYTQDYNKTSIKKINNKVIKKAQENLAFKKVSVNDFLHIASILKNLLKKRNYTKVAELMKPYGLKLKEIESIIKIDKLKKPQNFLTSKQKNILKELLEVK